MIDTVSDFKTNKNKVHVVSFSGGRTSAFLIHIMEKLRKLTPGLKVDYIFIDTGAEHPETYDFAKRCVKYFGIKITYLRAVFSEDFGVGPTYKVVQEDEIKHDLKPFEEMIACYGTPYNPSGGFCTDKLKTVVSDKYCDEKYGKNGCYKLIGYRYDEPKRVFGDRLYSKMLALYSCKEELSDIARKAMSTDHELYFSQIIPQNLSLFDSSNGEVDVLKMANARFKNIKKKGFRFLLELSAFEKQDVIDWWKEKKIDLTIPEWSGNCVFCIKKGENKLALAIKDNPDLYEQYVKMLNRAKEPGRINKKFGKLIMYRGHNSIISIKEKYKDISREELIKTIKGNKSLDTGSCSESCEPYSDQFDLLEEV